MKSVKQVLSVWCIMFAIAMYISSCCTTDLKIIGEGTIQSTALDRAVNTSSDTITGPFKIDIFTEIEVVYNDLSELGFTQGLAVACNEDFVNTLDIESIEIILDKDFQYENSNFEAQKDLVSISEVKTQITVSEYVLKITFDAKFFSKAKFEKETYNLKVNFKTSDGVSFSNDINLVMDI